MVAIEINGKIQTYKSYPKEWTVDNVLYQNISNAFAEQLGFKRVVVPTHDKLLQFLGELYLDGDKYTYKIIDRDFTTVYDILDADGNITGQTMAYDINVEKARKISELKAMAGELLKNDDWYWIRKTADSIEPPQEIKDRRIRIKAKCDAKEVEINALINYVDVLKYVVTYQSPKLDADGNEIVDEFGKTIYEI